MSSPRYTIIRTYEVPPGGWRYHYAPTDTLIRGSALDDLLHNVREHLVANGQDMTGDWEQAVEDGIGEILGGLDSPHVDEYREPVRPGIVLQTRALVKFTNIFRSWLETNFETVPQAEADRRAKICMNCPKNVLIDGCKSCRQLAGRLLTNKLDRSTKYDGDLIACSSCLCILRLKVWMPKEVDPTALGKPLAEPYAEGCWVTE